MAIRTEIFKAKRDYEGEYAQYNTPADRIVVVDGVEYDNFPGGTVETRDTAYGPKVFSIHHAGLVIATRERNWIDDSDFYAVVWDPTTKTVGTIDYATTRMGGTDDNYATPDLADEYKADYAEFLVVTEIASLRRRDHDDWERAAYEATKPHKGATVRVVKGRKVEIGFTGTVIWVGEDGYGKTRVGIKADDRVEFTAASNVAMVVDMDDLPYEADFTRTDAEYRRIAELNVGRGGLGTWLRGTQAMPGMVVVA